MQLGTISSGSSLLSSRACTIGSGGTLAVDVPLGLPRSPLPRRPHRVLVLLRRRRQLLPVQHRVPLTLQKGVIMTGLTSDVQILSHAQGWVQN